MGDENMEKECKNEEGLETFFALLIAFGTKYNKDGEEFDLKDDK